MIEAKTVSRVIAPPPLRWSRQESATPAREIVMRPVAKLTTHRLARVMPMLPPDAPEMEALRVSIVAHGLDRQPLIINPHDDIMDGRHRQAMAIKAGLTDVPCVILPDEDAASIIVETLLARRHYTKGARAYLAAPLMDAAAKANSEARTRQLLRGTDSRNPTQLGFGKTEVEFAEQLGFSVELARQAKDLHGRFTKADKAVRGWKTKYPELVQEAAKSPGGLNEFPLPKFADALPDDLRARFEPKILAGETGLGAVIQAIVGMVSTKGLPKGSTSHGQLLLKGFTDVRVRFGRWDQMEKDEQADAIAALPALAKSFPPQVRAALAQELLSLA